MEEISGFRVDNPQVNLLDGEKPGEYRRYVTCELVADVGETPRDGDVATLAFVALRAGIAVVPRFVVNAEICEVRFQLREPFSLNRILGAPRRRSRTTDARQAISAESIPRRPRLPRED